MEEIFHMTEATQWYAAAAVGAYTGSTRDKTLAEVGFIHCSFAHQVDATRALIYADTTEPLVLLTIDPARVAAPIKVEQDFPHIYGPLTVDAVTEVRPLDG